MAKKVIAKEPTGVEKAKALVDADKKERAIRAWKRIEEALKEENCILDFALSIEGQSVPAQQVLKEPLIIHVVPK